MAIYGKKRENLSAETILKRITPYDIFRYYMQRGFEINQPTYSPFRSEDNPSFLIGNRYGFLYYIDFGDTSKRGDCFDFVKELNNFDNIDKAFRLIDKDFGLGILPGHTGEHYKQIKSAYKQPEEVKGKRYCIIQVITRKFTNEELEYWNSYHQDIQDLRDNNIYSISKLYLDRKLFRLKEDELRFGYLYDNSWKIYRPYNNRRTKWLPNNVPIDVMEGKENIKDCNVAFINKSKKDYMVIKKIFPTTCAVQNEGLACFTKENVNFLKENSSRQVLSFDSDVSGVKNSQQITKLFNFDYCNVPRYYLRENIKDWADLARLHGLNTIEDYLRKKQII